MINFIILGKTLTVGAGLWIVYQIVRSTKRRAFYRRLAQEWGCRPPSYIRNKDPIFGLDGFIDAIRCMRNHIILQDSRDRFIRAASHTYASQGLNSIAFSTKEPENIKTILSVRFEDYALRPLRSLIIPAFGESIFTTDGAQWQRSRAMLRPMFTRTQIADLSILEQHVNLLLPQIPLNGSTVDLKPLFFRLAMDVATHAFIGESTNCLNPTAADNDAVRFADAFNALIASFGELSTTLSFLGLPMITARIKRYIKTVNDFVDSHVLRAIEQKSTGKIQDKSDKNARCVFLHELVAQTDDVVQIRTEILSTLLAGKDTTASMLNDLWFELARHPHVYNRLREEVDGIAGQEITLELLKSMKYLRAVLNENLRIHPVVPENGRVAVRDTTLPLGGGENGLSPILVPKGSYVVYSANAMHRRRDIYGQDAEEFKPERWINTEEQKTLRPGWGYLPFNGGPRVCIGQQFALAEISYVTVRMVQRIRSLESRDPKPWTEDLAMNCTNLNGCKVALTGSTKRKVKCDETKPTCLRCRNLKGTKCEGYETPRSWIFESVQQSTDTISLTLRQRPDLSPPQEIPPDDDITALANQGVARSPSSWQGVEIETRSLNYYATAVAEVMACRSDRHYWTVITPQASLAYKSVKHALVALSMIAEAEKFKPRTTSGDGIPQTSTAVTLSSRQAEQKALLSQSAFRQYSLAINTLMSESDPSIEEVLITCITLYTFENWTRSMDKADRHMQGAVKLMIHWKAEHQQRLREREGTFTPRDITGTSEGTAAKGLPKTVDEEMMRRYIIPMIEEGMRWHELWLKHRVLPQDNFLPRTPPQ